MISAFLGRSNEGLGLPETLDFHSAGSCFASCLKHITSKVLAHFYSFWIFRAFFSGWAEPGAAEVEALPARIHGIPLC